MRSSHSVLWHLHRRNEAICPRQHLYTNVSCGGVNTSQTLEASQKSINWWKESPRCTPTFYRGLLTPSEADVGAPGRHGVSQKFAERQEPDNTDIICFSLYDSGTGRSI